MKLRRLVRPALKLALALVMLVVLLAFSGVFRGARVEPGVRAAPPGEPAPQNIGEALRTPVPITYEAVGTVRSRTRVTVAPQVAGQIVELLAVAGDRVEAGAELARLETNELEARQGQSRAALGAARAARDGASTHRERILALFERKAATPEQRDAAETGYLRAEAEVAAAEQRLAETEIALARTRVASPLAGVVTERLAEPGDLAWPGRALYVIHDPGALRLEAAVREGLYSRVTVGEEVALRFPALELEARGVVDEVVPAADAASRSFLVKVALPDMPELVPGMFGRLELPLGVREVVLVPERAIARVGQLATVHVRQEGRWERRHVALGELHGDRREVLAGLAGGEEIGWSD